MMKAGDKVRYVGPDLVAYETGKIYEVTGYDEELDAYAVMSELDEAYLLAAENLEEIQQPQDDTTEKEKYLNVFEFQEKYDTVEKRLTAMKKMSEREINYLIASCGTPQGKKHYSDMAKQAKET